MVLKMIVSILKNRVEKLPNLAKDILKNVLRLGEPNQTARWKQFLIDILGQVDPFFKPIFALKPLDQDGCFEYNKRYKRSF